MINLQTALRSFSFCCSPCRRWSRLIVAAWLLVCCLLPATLPAAWHHVETPNFRVWADQPELAARVAAACEEQRSDLRLYWGDVETKASSSSPAAKVQTQSAAQNVLRAAQNVLPERWATRCEVIVHPTQAQYVAAVGPGGEQSFGASYWRLDQGRIAHRRIDLRSDQRDPCVAALPHELTHLVIADRFPTQPIPRWLDEGIALLADPLNKQRGHEHDWLAAQQASTAFRLVELLDQQKYPAAERVQTFYGQSAAMVRDLLRRRSPAELLRFIETAQQRGYDAALRQHYGFENLSRWEEELLQQKSSPGVSPELVQYQPVSATREVTQ
jgi:hypothetical protein